MVVVKPRQSEKNIERPEQTKIKYLILLNKGLFRGVTEVAVKQFYSGEYGEPMSGKAREELIQEVKILKTLQHPNLVNFELSIIHSLNKDVCRIYGLNILVK